MSLGGPFGQLYILGQAIACSEHLIYCSTLDDALLLLAGDRSLENLKSFVDETSTEVFSETAE